MNPWGVPVAPRAVAVVLRVTSQHQQQQCLSGVTMAVCVVLVAPSAVDQVDRPARSPC